MKAIIILLLFLAWSFYLRVADKVRNAHYQVPEHARPTPFSSALQEIVAHAGGIYLSLVLLVSFLKIEVATEWDILGVCMEPLAFLSVVFTIIQPAALKIYRAIGGN